MKASRRRTAPAAASGSVLKKKALDVRRLFNGGASTSESPVRTMRSLAPLGCALRGDRWVGEKKDEIVDWLLEP